MMKENYSAINLKESSLFKLEGFSRGNFIELIASHFY
jgi:hypothetical protein